MGHLVRMVDVGLRYERIWRAAVGLLAAIGVLSALVFVSPATNLAAFLVAAFTIGAVCLSIGLGRDLPNADLLRTVPRGAVLGALFVLAICGYAAAVGARTVMLVLVVIGVSPPVVGWLRSGSSNGEPAWTNPGRGTSPAQWAEQDAGRPRAPWGGQGGGTGSTWDERGRGGGRVGSAGSGRGDAPEPAGGGNGRTGFWRRKQQPGAAWGERRDAGSERGKQDRGDATWGKRGDGSTRFGRRSRRRVDRKLPLAPSLQEEFRLPKYLTAVVRNVGELTDEELCLAWRRSFTQLERAVRVDHRQAMVDVRRAYLDELERRHPESFASWLASNPRAAGNPARFFTHRADH
ncbi:hypothetical protein [Kribbella sp.]|uniref:hypothetical protein n=1 Tax=Kribbella sp. TaxID=1871183 RepID=UPI002D6257F9|nr:hypothetical protein [Kribbella sp.]HZX03986.1 hypothetical protein [Kribbella sp.]